MAVQRMFAMTPIELLCILLDGPFLPFQERIDSTWILIEHYEKTGKLPLIKEEELVLCHG